VIVGSLETLGDPKVYTKQQVKDAAITDITFSPPAGKRYRVLGGLAYHSDNTANRSIGVSWNYGGSSLAFLATLRAAYARHSIFTYTGDVDDPPHFPDAPLMSSDMVLQAYVIDLLDATKYLNFTVYYVEMAM